MSSPRTLRRIRKEFDYHEYCEEHFDVKRTNRPDEVRICCPACGDSKYKCYVNNEKKLFNCYKCDFKSGNYDVFDFVGITESLPRGVVMRRLAQEFAPTTPLTMEEMVAKLEGTYAEVTEDEDGPTSDIAEIDGLPLVASELAPLLTDRDAQPFIRYLVDERGLLPEEIAASKLHVIPMQHFQLHVTNGNGEEKYVGDIGRRILFPVYGPGGKLVSWLTRPISNDFTGPKYINCPDTEINRTLWPFVPPHENIAVLVEGIFDAIAVRRLGAPFSAYATFGKKIGYEQIQHLKAWGVTDVIVFYDVDAKRDIIRAVNDLKMHFNVMVPDWSEWPTDMDPGDTMKATDGYINLEKALCNPIEVDSLEYVAWQIR